MSLATQEKNLKSSGVLSGPSDSRDLPDWFREQQTAAWKKFESIPRPTRKDQPWRFSNVDLLDLAPFKLSGTVSDQARAAILEQSNGLDEVAARLVFAGDQLLERDVVSEQLSKRGVIFQPLERAMVEHADLFRKYFMSTEVSLGSAKFAALHQALVSSGTFLFVPRGVEIDQPIEIFHWLAGENATVFPHLLLVTDELAKVTVIEHFRSLDRNQRGFACGGSDLLAVAVATNEQEFDTRTLQDHLSPHTASDLLYKNALDDRARCTFGGLIRVEPHAHFTDAYQKVRNLLLSDDSEANSMPGLEILADNVRCTHGATSGQINEDEMFYLHSRGIPTKVAQRLIVTGFLNEVIQRLDQPSIADYLRGLIDQKFARSR